MVGLAGFEPATPCSQSRCATRLRYFSLCSCVKCGPGGTRTPGVERRLLYSQEQLRLCHRSMWRLLEQGERDSNPQPAVLETAALPIELSPYAEHK
jgi:hypothetical protein